MSSCTDECLLLKDEVLDASVSDRNGKETAVNPKDCLVKNENVGNGTQNKWLSMLRGVDNSVLVSKRIELQRHLIGNPRNVELDKCLRSFVPRSKRQVEFHQFYDSVIGLFWRDGGGFVRVDENGNQKVLDPVVDYQSIVGFLRRRRKSLLTNARKMRWKEAGTKTCANAVLVHKESKLQASVAMTTKNMELDKRLLGFVPDAKQDCRTALCLFYEEIIAFFSTGVNSFMLVDQEGKTRVLNSSKDKGKLMEFLQTRRTILLANKRKGLCSGSILCGCCKKKLPLNVRENKSAPRNLCNVCSVSTAQLSRQHLKDEALLMLMKQTSGQDHVSKVTRVAVEIDPREYFLQSLPEAVRVQLEDTDPALTNLFWPVIQVDYLRICSGDVETRKVGLVTGGRLRGPSPITGPAVLGVIDDTVPVFIHLVRESGSRVADNDGSFNTRRNNFVILLNGMEVNKRAALGLSREETAAYKPLGKGARKDKSGGVFIPVSDRSNYPKSMSAATEVDPVLVPTGGQGCHMIVKYGSKSNRRTYSSVYNDPFMTRFKQTEKASKALESWCYRRILVGEMANRIKAFAVASHFGEGPQETSDWARFNRAVSVVVDIKSRQGLGKQHHAMLAYLDVSPEFTTVEKILMVWALMTGEMRNHQPLAAHQDGNKSHYMETMTLFEKDWGDSDAAVSKGELHFPFEGLGISIRSCQDVVHSNLSKTIHVPDHRRGEVNWSKVHGP